MDQRREFLYSNLSKQLSKLNTNFEQLNKNMVVLKEQTEVSQRLAISQASMFMGAKHVFEETKPKLAEKGTR